VLTQRPSARHPVKRPHSTTETPGTPRAARRSGPPRAPPSPGARINRIARIRARHSMAAASVGCAPRLARGARQCAPQAAAPAASRVITHAFWNTGGSSRWGAGPWYQGAFPAAVPWRGPRCRRARARFRGSRTVRARMAAAARGPSGQPPRAPLPPRPRAAPCPPAAARRGAGRRRLAPRRPRPAAPAGSRAARRCRCSSCSARACRPTAR
jgi:hypothetical protein